MKEFLYKHLTLLIAIVITAVNVMLHYAPSMFVAGHSGPDPNPGTWIVACSYDFFHDTDRGYERLGSSTKYILPIVGAEYGQLAVDEKGKPIRELEQFWESIKPEFINEIEILHEDLGTKSCGGRDGV